jgi:hypothetical protein
LHSKGTLSRAFYHTQGKVQVCSAVFAVRFRKKRTAKDGARQRNAGTRKPKFYFFVVRLLPRMTNISEKE